MEQHGSAHRNYSTISPSAKSLLMMKGHTNIPFAREMAEFLTYPDNYMPDFSKKDFSFWARVVHFESRYWSIEQLISELPTKNILELSSGFSCRGLETVMQRDVHYIETDLPDVIATKRDFIDSLTNAKINTMGKLEILPLNALDENQFCEIINRFPKGEIAVVNEGLLMYLDLQEKERLCNIIHKILKERGGYWITADIYVQNKQKIIDIKVDTKTKEFFEQHRINDNKFESFEKAKEFFGKAGFIIEREAKIDRSKLSSLKYLRRSMSMKQLFKLFNSRRMNSTWRLSVGKPK